MRPERLVSLDAFRGMTIGAMILVNNPGSWSHIYAPLGHATWHGWTPTDLVFPFFLFIVGVALALSLGRRMDAGEPPRSLLPKIFRRASILFGLGLFLSGFPSFDASTLRIPGVLQRIAICYLLGSLLILFTRPRTQVWIAVACLVVYWPLMTLVPVPGQDLPDIHQQGTNLAAYVDRWLMGGHLWKSEYDPEGVLSTMPALVTTMLGTAAGRILRSGMDPERRTLGLFLWGSQLAVVGYVWGWFFPINKALWTSSYAVFTGGLAFCALALCHWFFDLRGYKKLAHPFAVYGVNAITVFVLSGVLARLLGGVIHWQGEEGLVTLQSWIYGELLASWLSPLNASLAYALLWVLGWYAVLAWMHRRGIAIKV
jgi:predicted acyltransferase